MSIKLNMRCVEVFVTGIEGFLCSLFYPYSSLRSGAP